MEKKLARPVFLQVWRIRMPVTAVVSILHRAAGVVLFCAIPVLVWLFENSLRDAEHFQSVRAMLDSGAGRLIAVLSSWALCHHLFAGVRFLLLDAHIGVGRSAARAGARWVCVADVVALIVAGAAWL
jgi:succinate dehydrogenase / fumarate reductase cytochrome b subunit